MKNRPPPPPRFVKARTAFFSSASCGNPETLQPVEVLVAAVRGHIDHAGMAAVEVDDLAGKPARALGGKERSQFVDVAAGLRLAGQFRECEGRAVD